MGMDGVHDGARSGAPAMGWRPTGAVAAAILLEVVAFFALSGAAASRLALTPSLALGPQPFQLLTSAFVHADALSLLFDLLGLWLLGSVVERAAGTGRLIVVLVVGQLVGALGASLAGLSIAPEVVLAGAGFGIAALLGAMLARLRRAPVRVLGSRPVTAHLVGLLLLALVVGHLVFRRGWVELAGTLVAVAAGALCAGRPPAPARRSTETPRQSAVRRGDPPPISRLRLLLVRRRYRVISGGRDLSHGLR